MERGRGREGWREEEGKVRNSRAGIQRVLASHRPCHQYTPIRMCTILLEVKAMHCHAGNEKTRLYKQAR